jgi:hypothetical protein
VVITLKVLERSGEPKRGQGGEGSGGVVATAGAAGGVLRVKTGGVTAQKKMERRRRAELQSEEGSKAREIGRLLRFLSGGGGGSEMVQSDLIYGSGGGEVALINVHRRFVRGSLRFVWSLEFPTRAQRWQVVGWAPAASSPISRQQNARSGNGGSAPADHLR